ncbi:hypothetical protein FKW77_000633 [Venturia effusa]|uniref:Uncharacterized protein n=1 Tax=Venturia effusa TaxID=50376 RepID=A0A517LHY9_9PEZI|nr:hypothetical protein FKW77_000633 [Venturia effusa]
MSPPHGRKMYDGAPLSDLGLGPLINTAVNTVQRIWNEHDPIVPVDPEDEEDQYGPDGTPRAAIQGRRPRRKSTSLQHSGRTGAQARNPLQAVTAQVDLGTRYTALGPIAEYVSSDEEDFQVLSLVDEDEGWLYINARQQIDRKSGLSVPIMKEDPRYETDRRRKLSESTETQSRLSKVGERVTDILGYGNEGKREIEEGIKDWKLERTGVRQGRARKMVKGAERGAERSAERGAGAQGAAANRPMSKGHKQPARDMQTTAAALQDGLTRTPFSIEQDIIEAMDASMGSTMESVRSADSRHGTSSASLKRPVQDIRWTVPQARVENVEDDRQSSGPRRQPDTPHPRRTMTATSDDIPDYTVPWRRDHSLGATMEQPDFGNLSSKETHQARPRTKYPSALDLSPQASASAPTEQAIKENPKPGLSYIPREPSFPVGDGPRYGQPVTDRPPWIQNSPYRERSRSLDSSKWSVHDSDSDDVPRDFVAKATQIAPKDDEDWRIPPIGSNKEEKEQSVADKMKRNLQPTLEDVKDEGSIRCPPTFKDDTSIDTASKNTTEQEKEHYSVRVLRTKSSYSGSFTTISEQEAVEARKEMAKVETRKESDEDDEFYDAAS